MQARPYAAPRLAALFASVCFLTAVHAADNKPTGDKPTAPGLGDPGRITRIEIETGRLKDGLVTIAGRDAVQQLIVTAVYDSGQTRDWTRKATYDVSPAGLLRVDASGLIDPIARRGDRACYGRPWH